MNIPTNAFILLFTCLLSGAAVAQQTPPIVTLIEESTTGKFYDTIPASGPAIVDINSIIHVRINLQALENEMFRLQGIGGSDARLQNLNELNYLLRNENEILNIINRKFSGANRSQLTLEDFRDFAFQADEFLGELEERLSDELFDELTSPEVEARSNEYPGSYIAFVINFLEEKAQALRDAMMADLQVDDQVDSSLLVYFRLGAFLKNKSGGRPVHVENFDEINPDGYTEVSRFGAPISDEEKAALVENKLLSDSIQIKSTQTAGFFRQMVSSGINNIFPSDTVRAGFKRLYLESMRLLNQSFQTRPAAQVLLTNELNLARVEAFYQLAQETYESLAGNFPQDILKGDNFDQTLNRFEDLVVSAYQAYNRDVDLFQQTTSALAAEGDIPGLAKLKEVDDLYAQYVEAAKKDISGIRRVFQGVKGILAPFRKSYVENENLSEQVLRFTAGAIPPSGLLELKYIDKRDAGDEILFRAVIERGRDRNNRSFEQKELFRRYVGMARVSAHVKMSGSLILANPFNREINADVNSKLTNKFQFSPTYGIFMKWGSRKNKFYNDFVNFGVGLSFSSPDFNLDGTPEFGAGFIFTGLRDLLSVGWGWNFGVDLPYAFLGFNIPFAVGGIQSNVPETGFFNTQ